MFTGIVEKSGKVVAFEEGSHSWRLAVAADGIAGGVAVGDSVAVNGCCLTAVQIQGGQLVFDLLGETVRLTGFTQIKPGMRVNLERSLKADGRMGGHFVSGHIDATGTVEVFEPRGKDFYLRVKAPNQFLKYLAYKGSIAVDGISLTVAEVHEDGFSVWLIPHTVAVTNLCERKVGDRVNLEFDLLAKYMERLLAKE